MLMINSKEQWEEIQNKINDEIPKKIRHQITEIVDSEIFENDAGTIFIYFRNTDGSNAIHQACFTIKYEDFILYNRKDDTFISAFSTPNDTRIQEQLNAIKNHNWSNDYDYGFFFIPENDVAEIVFIL